MIKNNGKKSQYDLKPNTYEIISFLLRSYPIKPNNEIAIIKTINNFEYFNLKIKLYFNAIK